MRRIERAQFLLRETDRSVAEVCLDVGLVSVGSFTTSFKRATGMTPTQYRARARAPLPGIPSCILRKLTRPKDSRFREEGAPPPD